MDTKTKQYPFDTDDLEKGGMVQASIIEDAYGIKRTDRRFGLALCQAQDFIAKRFAERGEIVTVIQRHDDLVILTDSEASKHNEAVFEQGIRKSARAHARKLGIDRARLSEGERTEHDRKLEVQGRQLSAFRRAKRTVAPEASKRQTPAFLRAVGEDGDK